MKDLLFREDGNDFEDNKLKKIARESKDDTENDLNKNAFLFVFFVETTIQKPYTCPTK